MRKIGIYKYTRFFIFAVFTVFAVFAVAAHPAQALDPRCDPDVRDIQVRHAKFRQIVDQAIAQELTKQNDPIEALTCLDQQLIQSAKAGEIFSDTMPASFPGGGFNDIISLGLGAFGGSMSGPLAGWMGAILDTGTNPGFRGTTLLEDFNQVIIASGVLGELLSMFTDAVTGILTDFLGATVGGLLGPILGAWATGALADFFGGGGALDVPFDCDTMTDAWEDPTGALAGSPPDPYAYPAIKTGPKLGIDGDYRRAYPSEMEILTGAIPGLPTPADCTADPHRPLCDYVQKFYVTGSNATILGDVLLDLTNNLVPGGINAYKTAPGLSLNATLGDVLSQM